MILFLTHWVWLHASRLTEIVDKLEVFRMRELLLKQPNP